MKTRKSQAEKHYLETNLERRIRVKEELNVKAMRSGDKRTTKLNLTSKQHNEKAQRTGEGMINWWFGERQKDRKCFKNCGS